MYKSIKLIKKKDRHHEMIMITSDNIFMSFSRERCSNNSILCSSNGRKWVWGGGGCGVGR